MDTTYLRVNTDTAEEQAVFNRREHYIDQYSKWATMEMMPFYILEQRDCVLYRKQRGRTYGNSIY